jgi:hypothetical protein
MSIIAAGTVANLATRTLDQTLPSSRFGDGGPTPLERARERLARAKAKREAIDAWERYGTPLSILVGAAAALKGT